MRRLSALHDICWNAQQGAKRGWRGALHPSLGLLCTTQSAVSSPARCCCRSLAVHHLKQTGWGSVCSLHARRQHGALQWRRCSLLLVVVLLLPLLSAHGMAHPFVYKGYIHLHLMLLFNTR